MSVSWGAILLHGVQKWQLRRQHQLCPLQSWLYDDCDMMHLQMGQGVNY
jgi:hypothetical protein